MIVKNVYSSEMGHTEECREPRVWHAYCREEKSLDQPLNWNPQISQGMDRNLATDHLKCWRAFIYQIQAIFCTYWPAQSGCGLSIVDLINGPAVFISDFESGIKIEPTIWKQYNLIFIFLILIKIYANLKKWNKLT